MSTAIPLDRIGVGIDTARYGHRVCFLRPDRQPAAKPLTVLENQAGYRALQQRLESLHRDSDLALEAIVKGFLAGHRLQDAAQWAELWVERHPEDYRPWLYRGRASVSVSVLDLGQPEGDSKVFSKEFTSEYPRTKPIDAAGSNVLQFREAFLANLGKELSRYFAGYPLDETHDFDDRRFD